MKRSSGNHGETNWATIEKNEFIISLSECIPLLGCTVEFTQTVLRVSNELMESFVLNVECLYETATLKNNITYLMNNCPVQSLVRFTTT